MDAAFASAKENAFTMADVLNPAGFASKSFKMEPLSFPETNGPGYNGGLTDMAFLDVVNVPILQIVEEIRAVCSRHSTGAPFCQKLYRSFMCSCPRSWK